MTRNRRKSVAKPQGKKKRKKRIKKSKILATLHETGANIFRKNFIINRLDTDLLNNEDAGLLRELLPQRSLRVLR